MATMTSIAQATIKARKGMSKVANTIATYETEKQDGLTNDRIAALLRESILAAAREAVRLAEYLEAEAHEYVQEATI
jgi:hypothetical protein